MMKKKHILSAVVLAIGITATAQTVIGFETEDYKNIGVYDHWTESPFRTGVLHGNAGVTDNPDTEVDKVLGIAPNPSAKVLAVQRSRHAGNAFGVRIDLKEPLRVTKQMQYIHVMAYLKDKPADSRMMVMGLGKRLESNWDWQNGEDEQFWAITNAPVKAQAGWQDIVVGFKGFSHSMEENTASGIDIYSLVIVPDLRSPHADDADWVSYFDDIVVDNNPEKRFTTDKYAVNFDKETTPTRTDRSFTGVGLTVNGKAQTVTGKGKYVYNESVCTDVFSAKAGQEVQPTFAYTGSWMSAYVYADWGRDGSFSYDVSERGIPNAGSDIVSYSAAMINDKWYKSDGTTTANGNTIGAGVPKFVVPADAEIGFYRMRYKVDWNSLNPGGSTTIIADGGGIVDVTLDVHGDVVNVSASQLNGDIVLAEDERPLQNYQTAYNQPLKVKIIPEKGFVQNGFTLKYGYNVNATEQLDELGNPNWVLVNVPVTAINADNTYTIPGEYIRGGYVSIMGDMQQSNRYTVKVVGAPEGQGGVVYVGNEYSDGEAIDASQYFSADDVTAVPIDGYVATLSLDAESNVLTVTYKKILAYRAISDLSELRNDMAYHIKAKSGEGYLAWNGSISNTYVSLRGITSATYQGFPANVAVANIYKEEVSPFDSTVIWQILKEGNEYYLYQPANQCYVTRRDRDYVFTSNKTALDVIRDNGDGTFSFHAGGGYSESSTYFACICTKENPQAVRNWTWSDHGSKMYIIENPNIEVTDILTSVYDAPSGSNSVAPRGIYNLHGQKLSALPKEGIVIIDGKKKRIAVY
ncbi:MAG: hypothetical protein K2J00_03755 [Bacteroidaceae bacterium]|nr:hypothetical protein [Bacteroidaceae bacterium]